MFTKHFSRRYPHNPLSMKGTLGNFFLYIIGLIIFVGSFFYGVYLLFSGSIGGAMGMFLLMILGLIPITISYRIHLRKTNETMTLWGFLSYIFLGILYIIQ